MIESGRLDETKNSQGQPGVNYDALQSYRNIRDELTVNDERNLILRNTQLAIPESIQSRIIQLAHEGHQGICRTKALIRSKVWFPSIDSAVEKAVNCCIPCQANTNRARAEPLNMSKLPPGPWLDLSVDFCGPLPTGEYLLVITDEYSRSPLGGGDTGHIRGNCDPVHRKSIRHVRVPQSGQIRQWTTLPRRDLETVPEKLWHQAPKDHPSLASSQRTGRKPKQTAHESHPSCRCRRAQLETRTAQVPSNLTMHPTHQHTVHPISCPIWPGP